MRLAQLYGGGKGAWCSTPASTAEGPGAPQAAARWPSIMPSSRCLFGPGRHRAAEIQGHDAGGGLLLGAQRRGLDNAASAYLGIDLPKGCRPAIGAPRG